MNTADPEYHRGFFEFLDGVPVSDVGSPEYRAGWEAARATRDVFREAGFINDGRRFYSGPRTIVRGGETH